MSAFSLSSRQSKIVGVFGSIVALAVIVALKVSQHPILWLLGALVLVPVFAAIVGAIPEDHNNHSG
jgi:hypothetical protein